MTESLKIEIINFLTDIAPSIPKQDWVPYSVFISEELEFTDEWSYNKYMLHSISANGDCLVENPITKIIEPRELSEINLECLGSLLTFINTIKEKTV